MAARAAGSENRPARATALVKGRVVLLGIYATFVCVLAGSAASIGWSRTWGKISVSSKHESLLDMRSLTSAWACTRRGVDVLAADPCDRFHRPFNYPRIWTAAAHIGLGPAATIPLAILVSVAAVAALLLVARDLSPREAIVFAAVTLSPPVLLGFERGNTDLIVFTMVAVAVHGMQAASRRRRFASHIALFGACALKLYPVFAALALLRDGRTRRAGYILSGLFACYIAVTFHDLRLIDAGTPRAIADSYGAMTAPRMIQTVGGGRTLEVVALLIALGAALVAVRGIVSRHDDVWARHRVRSTTRLDLFWAGATIFLGTFLLGSNFEYRLIFLALTVPQLLEWSRRGQPEAAIARPILITLIGYVWLKHIAIAEPLDWIVAAGLTSMLWLTRSGVLGPRIVGASWIRVRRRRRQGGSPAAPAAVEL